MTYSVETLTAEHAADWLKLRLEGAELYPLGFLITVEEASEMTVDRAAEILSFGGMRGLFFQSQLVGFAGYRPERLARTRHRAEVGPFYIRTEHHGKGAAGDLMMAIVDEAKSAGVEQLELFVDTENARAIGFYEKFGFERIATHPDGVRIDGNSRSDHFYNKKLRP
ncbi:GNAT family N-acetyltransferase [Ruegeria sp. A3M17]|uniref:GNAT family N-acetyltransferase n=1 Tax=Ruegeria sp. A3M17 TaxID=2267229 RepID=UPI000DEA163B|nr:GNAT family N-acetyltransferase [Ruegeria sp. A3M17]RBW59101.1 GNAT family N-acetyltransferase [Ruegeria sp. A3M17]